MQRLVIYKDLSNGHWVFQNLTLNNSGTYRTINKLVNDCFSNYKTYLVKKYGLEFANSKIRFINSYLKNRSKIFDIIFIDFPGDLRNGRITENVHPLSISNIFF